MLDVSFTAEDIVDDFAASAKRTILATRIDCNKYRYRKALFYCGTEINTLNPWSLDTYSRFNYTNNQQSWGSDLSSVLAGYLRDWPTTSQKAGYAPVKHG